MNSRDHGTPKLKRKKYIPVLQKVSIMSSEDNKGLTTENNKPIRVKVQ